MREEDVQAVLDTLRSGWLTMGPRIKAFEEAFAAWHGAEHAVAVSSGTAALHLACLAVRLGAGDRVVVPAYGSPAALAAVRNCGAEPVFGDVAPQRPVLAEAPAARAAIVQHTYGWRCELPDYEFVIEDCRDALGGPVGREGTLACWSFADRRQLAIGEGGMVTTASAELADRVRLLRAHAMTSGTWDRHRGYSQSYDVVDIGFNFRLDEPRAALGLSRLSHIDEDLGLMRRRAEDSGGTPTDSPGWVVGVGQRRRALAELPGALAAQELSSLSVA